tara:strand:+ start:679 stop:1476 length:798 start_codon:yes stop_codon:yes gene_type:complete
MTNNTFTLRTVFSIVLISIISAFLVGGIVMAIALTISGEATKLHTFLSIIIGQSFMIVPLFLFLINKNEPLFNSLRIKSVPKEIILYSISISIGLTFISDEFDRIIQIFVPQPDYILDLNGALQPETTLGFVLLFIAVVIIAPLGEELLFRGFLQHFLEKYWKDITKAVLVTSLFFAFIHMNSYWFIQIYLLGIFLGYLSWKSGSIIPSLILHSTNNGAAILLSFTNINIDSIYLWKGHLSPIIILVALYLFFFGFRGINNSRLY